MYSEQGYGNDVEVTSTDIKDSHDQIVATAVASKNTGSNPPKYYDVGTALRLYANNTLSINMKEGYVLSKVVFTCQSGNTFTTASVTNGTLEGTTSTAPTWTASGTDVTSFTITNTASKGHARIQKIEITYIEPTSDLLEANLAYSTAEVNVNGILGEFNQPVLTYDTDATISYNSSNTAVATVSTGGDVTIVGYGTTTIKATAPPSDTYKAGSASYTLNVVDNRQEVTLAFEKTSDRVDIGNSYKNALTVTPSEAASAVVYSSSDEAIATVDNEGNVTPLSDGTVTIKAEIPAGNDSYKPVSTTYVLKVNDPNKLEEDFDFVNHDYGMTRYSSGTTYISNGYVIRADGEPVSITLTKGTGNGFRLWSDGLRVYSTSHTMTFNADEGFLITGITYTTAANLSITFEGGTAQNSTNPSWTGEAKSVGAVITVGSGKNVAITGIHITYKKAQKEAGLSFPADAYEVNYGETFTEPVLTKATDGAISYSSSDETVATVDAYGKVTIEAAGVTTITAKSEATDEYLAGEASYTLTVRDKAPRVELGLDLSAESNEVQLHKQLALNLTVTAPEGVEVDNTKFTVVYTSGNEEVATVDENGVVYGVALGKATITVDINDNDYYTTATAATFEVTVVDKRPQPVLAFDAQNGTVNVNELLPLTLNVSIEGDEEADLAPVKEKIQYTISDDTVGELVTEEGVTKVKGLKHGTVTVTAAITADDDIRAAAASITISVVDPNVPVYTLVEDAKDIVPLGEYVIIGQNGTEYSGMTTQNSSSYRNIATVTVTNNQFELYDSAVAPITLEPVGTNYRIKVTDGYLQNPSDNKNNLTTVNASSDAIEYSLTLNTSNNLVTILGNGKHLKFNFGSPRFTSYATNNTGQKHGSLYKLPGTGLYAPTITNEDNIVTITRDARGDASAKIYYTLDGGDETLYTGPFPVSKVGTEVSAVVKSGTFSSAAATETINWTKTEFGSLTELFNEGTDGTDVTLNFPLTALYQNGEYLYVKDADKHVLIKGATENTYNNGDVLAAGSVVSYSKANGIVTLAPVTLTAATAGEAVAPTESEMVSVVTKANNAAYYALHPVNVTMTDALNGTITEGNRSVALYNQFGLEIESGRHLTVTGFVNATESGVQFFPILVEARAADAVPEEVVFTVGDDPTEYTANQDGYTFPMGTKLVFESNYATSLYVTIGDNEEVEVKEGHFVYTVVNPQGEIIEITPFNDNLDADEDWPSYDFIITAEAPKPVFSGFTAKETVEDTDDDGNVISTTYTVDRNTEVTITCPLADQIEYMIDEEPVEVLGNTATFTVTQSCSISVWGSYLDDNIYNMGNAKYVDSEVIKADFKIYVPTYEILDFKNNDYGLTRMSGNVISAIGDRTLDQSATYSTYVVNNAARLYAGGLRMYEQNANSYITDAGTITVNAPVGYVIENLETGTLNNGFTTSLDATAARFEKKINHGRVSGSISYTHRAATGNKYWDVPAIRVTLAEAVAPENMDPNVDKPDEVFITKLKTGGYRIDVHLPADCHLYYRHNPTSTAAYGPRRAVDHSGYTQAELFPYGEDIHSFTVPTEGTVEFYTHHPATDTQGNIQTLSVDDDHITSGVEDITVDGAEEGVYYNLQGLRVENPGAGVYIRVINGQAVKVRL